MSRNYAAQKPPLLPWLRGILRSFERSALINTVFAEISVYTVQNGMLVRAPKRGDELFTVAVAGQTEYYDRTRKVFHAYSEQPEIFLLFERFAPLCGKACAAQQVEKLQLYPQNIVCGNKAHRGRERLRKEVLSLRLL